MKWYDFGFHRFKNEFGKHNTLVFFGYILWASYNTGTKGWFRLFGVGIKWKNVAVHGFNFSERNGLASQLQIGKWSLAYVPKIKWHKKSPPPKG